MYLSKISLKESSESCEIFRNLYTLHKAIWGLFDNNADDKRDFLYRLEYGGRRPVLYAVSARKPVDSAIWHVETKSYEPVITNGMRLEFKLTANPVRAKRDGQKKQHRHDVIMDAKKAIDKESDDVDRSLAGLVQEEGCKWLMERAVRYGFALKIGDVRADGYQQRRLFKEKRKISFSTVDFNGILIVHDRRLFVEALCKGIGHAKGFGCGMMMIRRA